MAQKGTPRLAADRRRAGHGEFCLPAAGRGVRPSPPTARLPAQTKKNTPCSSPALRCHCSPRIDAHPPLFSSPLGHRAARWPRPSAAGALLDFEFSPAVHRPAFGIIPPVRSLIGRNRPALPIPYRLQAVRLYSPRDQVAFHCIGPPLRQPLVIGLGPNRGGVPFDGHPYPRVILENLLCLIQHRRELRLDGGLVEVEGDPAQDDLPRFG